MPVDNRIKAIWASWMIAQSRLIESRYRADALRAEADKIERDAERHEARMLSDLLDWRDASRGVKCPLCGGPLVQDRRYRPIGWWHCRACNNPYDPASLEYQPKCEEDASGV